MVLIVLGIISMNRINDRLEQIANRTTYKIWYATMIQDSAHIIENAILNMIVARDHQNVMIEYVRIMTARKTHESAIEKIEKLEDSPHGVGIISRMKEKLEDGKKENDRMIELVRDGKYGEAERIFLDTSHENVAVVHQVCSELVNYEKEQAGINYNAATKTYHFTSIMFIAMGVLAILMASAAAVLLTRSITIPLRQGVRIANRIGEGDLSVEIESSEEDETGKLLKAMGEMVEKLRKMNELEHQLIQSQKHETVGRLAGGIAHDFNNMLSIILGNTQLIKMKNPNDDKISRRCSVIETTVMRASDFVKQLLAFSRKQMLELRCVKMDELVSEFEKMMRRMVGENIEMSIVPRSKLTSVKVDTAQINQVILNLVVNAREAMPKGGMLSIETDMVFVDKGHCRFNADAVPGSYVVLSVSDTGIGMSNEVAGNVFEPFFTTKENGTGLGLSVVYGIVRQHGGFIDVVSEMGKGTRFSVYLPYAVDEKTPSSVLVEGNGFMPGEGEMVLIVEDDDHLRETVAEMLSLMGYRVDTASDGLEGVRIFKERCREIDLVLLDIVMPKKSGFEAYREMCAINPSVPSIFVTGYNTAQKTNPVYVGNDANIIQKPYSIELLSQRIREVLDRERRAMTLRVV